MEPATSRFRTIHPLVEDCYLRAGRFECVFRCPVTGKLLVSTVARPRLQPTRWRRLLQSPWRPARRRCQGLSPRERRAGILAAFHKVAVHFRWDEAAECLRLAEPTGPPLGRRPRR